MEGAGCAAPDAPTVLIYGHHDVRAAKEEWDETTPFKAVIRDGYVYGRGSSDAKGQVLAHAPVVYFGTGLPEDRWHDSDERTSIKVLLAGAATLATLWPSLASG
ncbi:M20/M25/M40 family metallo-hydrolase [Actinoplanes sp. GCM10030250]|uniref:M20/M25/M40 family metallo-hydrolase n=1 Tax=Actinoplanes sp. GCM10030250 TaxID=3273376 RepID=UPI0036133E5F